MEHRIDWKSKLTSRKLWMAVVGLVSGILVAMHMDEHEVTQITGIIMRAGPTRRERPPLSNMNPKHTRPKTIC